MLLKRFRLLQECASVHHESGADRNSRHRKQPPGTLQRPGGYEDSQNDAHGDEERMKPL
jgi:hypothetical protein